VDDVGDGDPGDPVVGGQPDELRLGREVPARSEHGADDGLGTEAEPTPSGTTPVDLALDAVLSEIDQFARATFSSITLATMLRLMQRRRQKAQRPAAARA